jgi:Trypsin-co-occurring domain 1
MASRVLRFSVGDGTNSALLVEVDDSLEAGNRPVAQGVIEKARQSLEAALAELTPGVTAIVGHLRDLASKPDEFGMEFGIKFSAEAGALIAKTALEGNIKVSLKWTGVK